MYKLLRKNTSGIALLLVIAMVLGLFPWGITAQAAVDAPANWADENRNFRIKLSFDNSASEEDLIDFPTMIKLDDSLIDYSVTGPDDLHFYDADNQTELPYEVESWNESGDSHIWVKVPRISARSTDDHIWLYYGGTNRVETHSQDVWSNGYLTVHHFEEQGGKFLDSSANGKNGTSIGEVVFHSEGIVGSSMELKGKGTVDLGYVGDGEAALTVAGWVYLNKMPTGWTPFFMRDVGGGSKPPHEVFWVKGYQGKWNGNVVTEQGYGPDLTGGQAKLGWSYLTLTYDSNQKQIILYADGVAVASRAASGKLQNAIGKDGPLHLGSYSNSNESFQGRFDELQISNIARSAAWVQASYLNMTGKLVSFGVPESKSNGGQLEKLSIEAKNLNVGQVAEFRAIGTYQDGSRLDLKKKVSWSSSNPQVATVSAGGVVQALQEGITTISASLGDVSTAVDVTVAKNFANPQPASGSTGPLNPELKVRVVDPNGKPLNVTFMEKRMDSLIDFDSRDSITGSVYADGYELPAGYPQAGEMEMSTEDYADIASADDRYYRTETGQNYSYQRYDLKFSQDLNNAEEVTVNWEGRSNQVVELYVWNFLARKWVQLDSGTGDGSNDFQLSGKLDVETMVKDQEAHFLIGATQKDISLPGKVPSSDEYEFTFAWETDTQYYSESYPHIYDTINKWIVENKDAKKIKYVIHTGDIVDNWDQEYQWQNADKSMKLLDDANIPYGVVAGNHDVAFNAADYKDYWRYFGRDRYANKPWYGGDRDNNRDHYDLISAGGMDFIILYLGFKIEQQSIDWANEVLRKYPNHKAIIGTHAYIDPKGKYGYEGKMVMEKLVAPNPNVFLVVNGHYHGAFYNVKRMNGRVVYEVLHDYQAGPEGGQGYIRLLHFNTKENLVYMNTYSPYLDDYNFFDNNAAVDSFTIPLDADKGNMELATDQFDVKIKYDSVIGSVYGVPSGSEAEVTWTGLEKGKTYNWYVSAMDSNGQKVQSDVWSYTASGQVIPSLTLSGLAPMQVGETDQAVVELAHGDGSSMTVTDGVYFASSNGQVATVTQSGLVHALSPGETVISATYKGMQADYRLIVQAVPVETAFMLSGPSSVIPGGFFDMAVDISKVKDLYGASVKLKFDPSQLQVVDADPNLDGVQVSPGALLEGATISNAVYNENGLITFAVTKLGDIGGTNGAGLLAKIRFQVAAGAEGVIRVQPQEGNIQLANSQNVSIPVLVSGYQAEVKHANVRIKGSVTVPATHHLSNLSGFFVQLQSNGTVIAETMTDENGQYSLPIGNGSYTVIIQAEGYKQRQIPVTIDGQAQTVTMEPVPMYIGDFDSNQTLDILDIVLLAKAFEKDPTGANSRYDVDRDGDIDIFDVVTVARNFGK